MTTPHSTTPGLRPRRLVARFAVVALAAAAAWAGAVVPRSPAPTLTLSYGHDPKQVVLVYPAQPVASAVAPHAQASPARRPPLAVFVHGGAWRVGSPQRVRARPQWFREAGGAFASGW